MNAGQEVRNARRAAGLSQAELAAATATSQATISAYERGRKQPSVETLERLLAASGSRLRVEHGAPRLLKPSAGQRARTARTLSQVLALAAALPVRHRATLRYPRLPTRAAAR